MKKIKMLKTDELLGFKEIKQALEEYQTMKKGAGK